MGGLIECVVVSGLRGSEIRVYKNRGSQRDRTGHSLNPGPQTFAVLLFGIFSGALMITYIVLGLPSSN